MEQKTFMERVSIKAALAGKTFGEKVEYLWTYYKWVLVMIALLVGAISTVATSVKNSKIETIYSGTLVNIDLSAEGTAFLSDDLFAHLGGEAGRQQVDLTVTYFKNSETYDPEMDSVAVMRLMASVVAQELDYAIMNEVGYDYYRNQTVLASLDEVLPQELLEQFDEEIVYYTDEERGEIYPLAIDITQWPIVQDCIATEGTVYLTFCNGSDSVERNTAFIAYLLGWE